MKNILIQPIWDDLCFLMTFKVLRPLCTSPVYNWVTSLLKLIAMAIIIIIMMFFHLCLRDSKFPLVFRTLLSTLADPNIPAVPMVSIQHLISKSSSIFCKYLGNILSAPLTMHIRYILMFQSFLSSLARSTYYFTPLRFFHNSVSWLFLIVVRVISSLPIFPGHFSVSWPILIMM